MWTNVTLNVKLFILFSCCCSLNKLEIRYKVKFNEKYTECLQVQEYVYFASYSNTNNPVFFMNFQKYNLIINSFTCIAYKICNNCLRTVKWLKTGL